MRTRSRVLAWSGCAAAAALLAAAPARAQEDSPRLLSDAVEIDFGGRVQTQLNTTTVDGVPPSRIFMRRARLDLEVRASDLVSGRLQFDVAGGTPQYRDAYVQLDLSPGLAFRAGNTYRPFSLIANTSSTRILAIERGLVIPGLEAYDQYALVDELEYADRDLGAMVLGAPAWAPLGLTYQAGVFAGPLQGEIGDEQRLQYSARAAITPLERVRLGAGWSSRGFARPAAPEGSFDLERGHAFEVDLEYGAFAPGFHLLAELSAGDADPFEADSFLGAQAWLGYRTGSFGRLSAVEPILRLSTLDVDLVSDVGEVGGTLVTPGLNLYLGGSNRLMFNYDLWLAAGDAEDQGSFKSQLQLVF